METEVGAIAEGQHILIGDDVMEAQFKLQEATENGEPAQKLYLKTFQPIDRDMQIWQARPESEWPLLATILANRIIMYPIHANPHTKRYQRSQITGSPTMTVACTDEGKSLMEVVRNGEFSVLQQKEPASMVTIYEVKPGYGQF